MNQWVVEFATETALREVDALPEDVLGRLLRILDLFRQKGPGVLCMPLARPIDGKLWELRLSGKDGIARSLYLLASGQRMVILRTFQKKTQKTPRQEINLALKRAKGI